MRRIVGVKFIDLLYSLLGAVVGGVITLLGSWLLSKRSMAVLKFDERSERFLAHFKDSVRLHLAVNYVEGRRPVTAAIPYLTVKYGGNEELPPHIFLRKGEVLFHKIAYDRSRWDYLVPVPDEGFATIINEALPWTVPKTPEGPYFHTCFIPVKGHGKVVLLDAYKYKWKGEEGYLLRVFSEYGTERKPRAVFKLPKGEGALKEELRFEVRVTGDNVRGGS